MKYRVRLDLSFGEKADAQVLMNYAKSLSNNAISINEGKDNEEMTVSAVYHICHHDEGLPCEPETEI